MNKLLKTETHHIQGNLLKYILHKGLFKRSYDRSKLVDTIEYFDLCTVTFM